MDIGPENFQKIFTASWYMDTIGYGVVIGAQALANFVIVQYGIANGAVDISPKVRPPLVHICCPLAHLNRLSQCNQPLIGLQPGCEVVFKARGTAFATLLLILMVHGLTVRICQLPSYSHLNSIYSLVQELDQKLLPYEAFREYFPPVVNWLPRTDRFPVSMALRPFSELCSHISQHHLRPRSQPQSLPS